MRIAVTTFYTESYQPLADITIPILDKYCNKHGYVLHINKTKEDNIHFVKTKDAKNLLDEYSLVWGVECDFLITNLNYKITDFINWEADTFLCKDVNGVNSGSVIFKSTDLCRTMLNCLNSYKGNIEDEQIFFENQHDPSIKYLSHPSINSIPYEPYYAPSYGRYNFMEGMVSIKPTVEEGQWEPGQFVMHLPGMTMERRIEIFNNHLKDIIW